MRNTAILTQMLRPRNSATAINSYCPGADRKITHVSFGWKPETGDTKNISPQGNASENNGSPLNTRYLPPCRRSSTPSPGRHLSTSLARRVRRPLLFFGRGHKGLLCGVAVVRPRGRERYGVALGGVGASRGVVKQNRF